MRYKKNVKSEKIVAFSKKISYTVTRNEKLNRKRE